MAFLQILFLSPYPPDQRLSQALDIISIQVGGGLIQSQNSAVDAKCFC